MCPDGDDSEEDTVYFDVARTNAHRRAGNNWEYDWSNLSGDQELGNGDVVVIVWGRDRSSYMQGEQTGIELLGLYDGIRLRHRDHDGVGS